MAKTPAPAPAPPVAIPMTTVDGYAIQIMGFVPIPKGDLRKQIEIPQLMLDITEGRKTVADIIPHMKGMETRQQYLRRRFEVAEVKAWSAPPKPAAENEKAEGDRDEAEVDNDGT